MQGSIAAAVAQYGKKKKIAVVREGSSPVPKMPKRTIDRSNPKKMAVSSPGGLKAKGFKTKYKPMPLPKKSAKPRGM